jgi:hypothetical protein
MNDNNFPCLICRLEFAYPFRLSIHMIVHCDVRRYFCLVCGGMSKRKYDRKQHMIVHCAVRRYFCLVCGEMSTQKNDRKRHLIVHCAVRRYFCLVCGEMSTTKGNRKQHMIVHCAVRRYFCLVCGEMSTQKNDRKKHMIVHCAVRRYFCLVCGEMSTTKGSRKQHMIVHCAVRRYFCLVCGEMSTQKGSRKKHMIVHCAVRRYFCLVCGEMSTTKGSRKQHMIVHCAVRRYFCLVCGESFSFPGSLRDHTSQFFCSFLPCVFEHLGPCSQGPRFILSGHPQEQVSCAGHAANLHNDGNIVNHNRWAHTIPSSPESFVAYPGILGDPLPVRPPGNFLYAPIGKVKTPSVNRVPPFTLARFLEAVRELVEILIEVDRIPIGWTAYRLAGFILGQALGDGSWRNGAIIYFDNSDDNRDVAGMEFYRQLARSLGGDLDDVVERHAPGCMKIQLRGEPGIIINRMLSNLHYYAAYKYINMTMLDVFNEHHNNINVVHFLQGSVAGLISSDGSGSNNCLSFCQSQWWHADILIFIREIALILGIQVHRGYARRGPPLLGGSFHPSMVLIFRPCQGLRDLSGLITAGSKRNSAGRENLFNDLFNDIADHLPPPPDFHDGNWELLDDEELNGLEDDELDFEV